MNHPNREEWVPYLFGEGTGEMRREVGQHLRDCPECRQEIERWRRSLDRLDSWKVLKPIAARERLSTGLRWAWGSTMVAVLAVGLMVGRLAVPSPAALRAEIETGLRDQLRQELTRTFQQEINKTMLASLVASREQTRQLLSDYARALDADRASERDDISSAMQKLEAQRLADFVWLKKDLDTVAVTTDAGFRQTQEKLLELADNPQDTSVPHTSKP